MSNQEIQDEFDQGNVPRKAGTGAYNKHHPVPTVGWYKQVRRERRQEEEGQSDTIQKESGKTDHLKRILHIGGDKNGGSTGSTDSQAFENENRNTQASVPDDDGNDVERSSGSNPSHEEIPSEKEDKPVDTSETATGGAADPISKRKAMKKQAPEGSRQVTDPVTHLPTTIHDFTPQDLKQTPENLLLRRSTTLDESRSKEEAQEIEEGHAGMQKLFPPPSFDSLRAEIEETYGRAFAFASAGVGTVILSASMLVLLLNFRDTFPRWVSTTLVPVVTLSSLVLGFAILWMTKGWLQNKIGSLWDDEVWDASESQEHDQQHAAKMPESAMWLNSTLSSLWPLINPDLFTSIADQIEDVMQASLPKVVRMIAVQDIGQGNEAIRILGVRWLPPGAAAKSVSIDGTTKSDGNDQSDRKVPDEGAVENEDDNDKAGPQGQDDSKGKKEEDADVSEGLEAESGDFINVELSFSYRATSKGKSLSQKAQSAHLYLVFYLPGNLPVPVWASLKGLVGTLRLRLQTSPDPPFFNSCTLVRQTFLGQPKADVTCVPLVKKGFNVMDLPLISSFVNSSISAALAEYVAPKSLTLDLKQMLTGDDFKKDTTARGIIYARVIDAQDMKEGDGSIPLLKDGSNDCYVSCGEWEPRRYETQLAKSYRAKFSKPLWSTRVIQSEMNPHFDEHCMILVGPEELNAQERLRVQLWDSDRTSADDDLGRIEIDLKELMQNDNSKGKVWQRQDSFLGMDGSSSMPGKLNWEVGYFDKVGITDDQLARQDFDTNIRSMKQLKDKVTEDADKKLREASDRNTSDEASQQRSQDFSEQETNLLVAAPPPDGYSSGILSVQIHNATGLELANLRKTSGRNEDDDLDEDDLPSPYCNLIINGKKVYRTRTKPKNAKPFFNASTERFIRDWRNTEVLISMRDSRVHEEDPLLGIVYLPLEHLFHKRSQINDNFPLSGGVGYGRLRVSMVFRAVDLRLPKQLLGWECGTIEIGGPITSNSLPEDLKGLRLKLRTTVNHGKMHPDKNGKWIVKKDRKIRLAVQKRYSSPLVIELRKNQVFADKTPAFAILWLKDVPDDEDATLEVPVWRGDSDALKRAQANILSDMGDRAGSLTIKLKLWAGLSDYHRKIQDPNMRDVMECLDAASDNKDIRNEMVDGEDDGSSSSSSSDSDSDGEDENAKDGGRNPMDQIKEYKSHHKTLHRQHRGVMQWKTARTGHYLKSRFTDGLGQKIKGAFSHHDGRKPDIETEV